MKKVFFLVVLLSILSRGYAQEWRPQEWPVLKSYPSDKLLNISLPIGGIGTGTVGLGGRGELRDWQIQNKPAINYNTLLKGNNAPFFSIWVRHGNNTGQTKGLIGPIHPSEYNHYEGRSVNHHGIPRFDNATFDAAYPFGQVNLTDNTLPVKVRIKGFNPLIPGQTDDSSIPIAIISYEVENTSAHPLEVSVCGSLRNFIGQDGSKAYKDWKGDNIPYGATGNNNEYRNGKQVQGIYMSSARVSNKDAAWGTMALTTNARQGVSYRTSSIANDWENAILNFWDDFSVDGELTEKDKLVDDNPMASLAVKKIIPAKGKTSFTFFLTWNFPNRLGWVGWNDPNHDKTIIGNYYSTKYNDAWDVAEKTIPQLPELEKKTIQFVNAITKSTFPLDVKEAALFNLSVLRSQTTFRIPSGHFMGWEGIMDETGSCYGSCTHVWNYEQATGFLFGDLSRSMRDVEFTYGSKENGKMMNRVSLPLDVNFKTDHVAAADGQMGTIMRFYRDWVLSGDNDFLKKYWSKVKVAMSYAWIEKGWDGNQDGVMEGRQHNTMDVDYFGPNPQMGFWYLGALKASAKMANQMGDKEFENKCNNLFAKGSKWMDENLFNGEYYEQKITDPATFDFLDMDDPKTKVPPFQLGSGCLVDQLVGQYMAHICGLGYLGKEENIKTTLKSIMKYNYLNDYSSHFNNMRSYVMGREAGILMGSYPKGRLEVPFPYFAETMTGFEYTAAIGMMYEGQLVDALNCVKAIRNRFDGYKRNPFSETECGHLYARSMASWAAILALSDFQYSGVDKSMQFTDKPGTYFWSNGSAWGTCTISPKKADLTVLNGKLELNKFFIKNKATSKLSNIIVNEGQTKEFAL